MSFNMPVAAFFVVFIFCIGDANSNSVENESFSADRALKISQAAVGRTVRNQRFITTEGEVVDLTSYQGRPLLLNLVYTSCHHTCSVLSRRLAQLTRIAGEALGSENFSVLTIGFDTAQDSPERLTSYAAMHGINDDNWRFLSADKQTVKQLTADLGFLYFPSPRGFDHTAQVTLLDQQGVVYRQIYNDFLQAPDIVEPLKQLIFGRRAEAATLDGWVNGLRLLCTVYDPNSGRYTFDYSIFVGGGIGFICLSSIAVFVVRAWRES